MGAASWSRRRSPKAQIGTHFDFYELGTSIHTGIPKVYYRKSIESRYQSLQLFTKKDFEQLNQTKQLRAYVQYFDYITQREQSFESMAKYINISRVQYCAQPYVARIYMNLNRSDESGNLEYFNGDTSAIQQVHEAQAIRNQNPDATECQDLVALFKNTTKALPKFGEQQLDMQMTEEIIVIDKHFNTFKYPYNNYNQEFDAHSALTRYVYSGLDRLIIVFENRFPDKSFTDMGQVVFDEILLQTHPKIELLVIQIVEDNLQILFSGTANEFMTLNERHILLSDQQSAEELKNAPRMLNFLNEQYAANSEQLTIIITSQLNKMLLDSINFQCNVINYYHHNNSYYRQNTNVRLTMQQYITLNERYRGYVVNSRIENSKVNIYNLFDTYKQSDREIASSINRFIFNAMKKYLSKETMISLMMLSTNNHDNEYVFYLMKTIFTQNGEFDGVVAMSVKHISVIQEINKHSGIVDDEEIILVFNEQSGYFINQQNMNSNIHNQKYKNDVSFMMQRSPLVIDRLIRENGYLLSRMPLYYGIAQPSVNTEQILLNNRSVSQIIDDARGKAIRSTVITGSTAEVFYKTAYGEVQHIQMDRGKGDIHVYTIMNAQNTTVLLVKGAEQFVNASEGYLYAEYPVWATQTYKFNDCEEFRRWTGQTRCLNEVDRNITVYLPYQLLQIMDSKGQIIPMRKFIRQNGIVSEILALKVADLFDSTCTNEQHAGMCRVRLGTSGMSASFSPQILFYLNLGRYLLFNKFLDTNKNVNAQYCITTRLLNMKICSKLDYRFGEEIHFFDGTQVSYDVNNVNKHVNFVVNDSDRTYIGCNRRFYNELQQFSSNDCIVDDKVITYYYPVGFAYSQYLQFPQYEYYYYCRDAYVNNLILRVELRPLYAPLVSGLESQSEENYVLRFGNRLQLQQNQFQYSKELRDQMYSLYNMFDNTLCLHDESYSFKLLETLFHGGVINITYQLVLDQACLVPVVSFEGRVRFSDGKATYLVEKTEGLQEYTISSQDVDVYDAFSDLGTGFCFKNLDLLYRYLAENLSAPYLRMEQSPLYLKSLAARRTIARTLLDTQYTPTLLNSATITGLSHFVVSVLIVGLLATFAVAMLHS